MHRADTELDCVKCGQHTFYRWDDGRPMCLRCGALVQLYHSLRNADLDGALCAQSDPDAWFSESKSPSAYAWPRKVCLQCPVREACKKAAHDNGEEHGMWGAETPKERARARRREKE